MCASKHNSYVVPVKQRANKQKNLLKSNFKQWPPRGYHMAEQDLRYWIVKAAYTCSHGQKTRKCIAIHSLTFDKQQIWYFDYVMQPSYYVHLIQKRMKENKQNLKQCNLTNVNIYSIVIQWVRVQTNIKAMAFQCPIIQQPSSTPMSHTTNVL